MNSKHFTAVLTALLITGFAAPAAAASPDSSNSNNGLFVSLKATISSFVGGGNASAEANAEPSANAGTSNAEDQHEENKGESKAFGFEFLSFLGGDKDSNEENQMPGNTQKEEKQQEQEDTQNQGENTEDQKTSAEADSETSVEAGETGAEAGTSTDSSLTVDEDITSEETSSDDEQQTEEESNTGNEDTGEQDSAENQTEDQESNTDENQSDTEEQSDSTEVVYEGDVGVVAQPSDAGATSTHTAYITVPENHRGSSFNDIEIDYSVAGSKADVSAVGSADIETLMVDTYSNSSTELVDGLDYNMSSASVQVKNEGHTLIVAPGSQPSYSLNTSDRIIVEYSGVTNPQTQGEFNVSVEVNSQSSSSTYEPSIAELVIG